MESAGFDEKLCPLASILTYIQQNKVGITMKTFYEGNSKKSGVYKIINTTNGRMYVGSAKEFKARFKSHLKSLHKGTHHNKFLQNDFNKCGEDAFEFYVIEVVEGDQVARLLVEQKYVDQYHDKQDSCYNFKQQTVADSRTCFSKDPEKTRKLLSNATKKLWKDPVYVEKRVASMKETANTPEFKQRQRQTTQEYWNTHPEKKEELAARASKYNKEHPEVIDLLKLNQPKGRETFKKRMKEDTELKAKYQEIATEKAKKLNQRYKDDPEYKNKMDALSKANISKYNEQNLANMAPKGSLVDPNGTVYKDIKNPNAFAKEHGLDSRSLYRLFSGELQTVKGWKLYI